MKKTFIYLLAIYKKLISKVFFVLMGTSCRHYPSCSEYASLAIEKYGVFKGSVMGLKRLISCNPFSNKDYYDPLV
jgi:putative membrane protein insertion efficiency factor